MGRVDDVAATLLALKDQALDATKRHDGAFYRDYLADDATAIVPVGVFGKEAVVAAMSTPGGGFQATSISDTQARVLGPDIGLVTYVATFPAPDGGPDTAVFVTTLYQRRDGTWKGVLYQQTPLRNR
jgi:uncharacterized protein (TIGR02246 family)